jgi:hypothetical protein
MVVESKLSLALKHVAGERRVVSRQRALVSELKEAGRDTAVALSILKQFECRLAISESDLEVLKSKP